MTSDLERDLQLALREGVDHVTPDRLRHDDPTRQVPIDARRVRWAVAGPILAAACVAVLALAITLVATNGNSGSTQTTTGHRAPPAALVGTSWTLVSVRHSGTTTSIPQDLGASVTFERRGVLSAQDGINTYRGAYTVSGPRTIDVQGGTVSAVGYAGRDPSRMAAIDGVGALFRSAEGAATRHPVIVLRDAETLQLTVGGYVLTLMHPLPVATSSAPATGSGSSSR